MSIGFGLRPVRRGDAGSIAGDVWTPNLAQTFTFLFFSPIKEGNGAECGILIGSLSANYRAVARVVAD